MDNRNRRNNLRVRGVPEQITDLLPAIKMLFLSLLPDTPDVSFTCDRIHRALRPKPPDDKPPRDIVLCLIKEDILRASCNTPSIQLDGTRVQIYPDLSPATLEKRRNLKEVTSVLQSARIRYRWGFPFELQVPHNGTTYTVTTLQNRKELLVKLGLLVPEHLPRQPSTPHPSPIWATPSPQWDRRRQCQELRELQN